MVSAVLFLPRWDGHFRSHGKLPVIFLNCFWDCSIKYVLAGSHMLHAEVKMQYTVKGTRLLSRSLFMTFFVNQLMRSFSALGLLRPQALSTPQLCVAPQAFFYKRWPSPPSSTPPRSASRSRGSRGCLRRVEVSVRPARSPLQHRLRRWQYLTAQSRRKWVSVAVLVRPVRSPHSWNQVCLQARLSVPWVRVRGRPWPARPIIRLQSTWPSSTRRTRVT